MKNEELPHKLTIVIASLDELVKQGIASESYVLLRSTILRAQTAIAEALIIEQNLADDAPLPLATDVIAFKSEMLRQLLTEIHRAINLANGKSSDVERIITGTIAMPELLEKLACRIGWRAEMTWLNQISNQLTVSHESILWISRNLAAPFLTAAAWRISCATQATSNYAPICPICASLPSLAKLRRDDGGRTLCCGLCGAAWSFARAECPFCHCGAKWERLADERDPYWLETCGDCRHYLKTIDERKIASETQIMPLAQDTATLHLDILAEREGLRKPPLYAALW